MPLPWCTRPVLFCIVNEKAPIMCPAGRSLLIAFLIPLVFHSSSARAVNLSQVWLLPEEGYPVFYRYFQDRITWFEAQAVCQFHHGELVTVDTSNEFDATRAYLKELDVTAHVWTGLKRNGPNDKFYWPNLKLLESEGYWIQEIPKSEEALCAAIDPSFDYRWTPLPCNGPQIAAFICQMEVPEWARKEDNGCLLTSLPSLTVTYLPDRGAVELISDCGLEGTRRIACKGQANHEDMIKRLSCETSTEATSDAWDDQPTRHRRESQVTVDMETSTKSLGSSSPDTTTDDWTPAVEVTTSGIKAVEVPRMSVATIRVFPKKVESGSTTAGSTMLSTPTSPPTKRAIAPKPTTPVKVGVKVKGKVEDSQPIDNNMIALVKQDVAAIADEGHNEHQESGAHHPNKKIVYSSKPIPPSLKGNSPFLETVAPTVDPTKDTNTTEEVQPPPDSHESFNENEETETHPPHLHPPHAPHDVVKKIDLPVVPIGENMQDSGEDHSEATESSTWIELSTEEPASTIGVLADEPELPERPNRGRLLVRPPHHSFYPYFLNRVLG